MIYTLTFNPAIDYVVHTDDIKTGKVNRLNGEQIFIGGKGINVSVILKELGIESTALGFVAGFTGAAIEDELSGKGINTDFIRLNDGFSRINVKIKSGEETELNGRGPDIPKTKIDELFDKLKKLNSDDMLVLAGSVPSSVPEDIYERILELVSVNGVRNVVDASGRLLQNTLRFKPYLIKPNNIELGEIFGVEINTTDCAIEYAHKLKEMGAENVLVSMADKGAVLVDKDGAEYTEKAHTGKVKNSVGAGDSMLAGFIAGIKSGDYKYALTLGNAAGAATAFSDGLATKDEIYKLK